MPIYMASIFSFFCVENTMISPNVELMAATPQTKTSQYLEHCVYSMLHISSVLEHT